MSGQELPEVSSFRFQFSLPCVDSPPHFFSRLFMSGVFILLSCGLDNLKSLQFPLELSLVSFFV